MPCISNFPKKFIEEHLDLLLRQHKLYGNVFCIIPFQSSSKCNFNPSYGNDYTEPETVTVVKVQAKKWYLSNFSNVIKTTFEPFDYASLHVAIDWGIENFPDDPEIKGYHKQTKSFDHSWADVINDEELRRKFRAKA